MTTTEVDRTDPLDSGTLEVFPPRADAPAITGVTLREHVNMMKEAHYFADAVCRTAMCPDIYRNKPQEATAVILYGHELGLSPIASLQTVINVHGKPGLEARTMKALLKSRGFKFRVTERSETRFRIEAWEPGSDKRNDPPDEVSEWTIERAVKAGFCPRPDPTTKSGYKEFAKRSGGVAVDGNMKYITQPTEMLEAKGTAEVCRAIAPEILLGLPISADEFDDFVDRVADTDDDEPAPAPPQRGRGTAGLKDRAKRARATKAPGDEPMDADEVPVPDAPVDDDPVRRAAATVGDIVAGTAAVVDADDDAVPTPEPEPADEAQAAPPTPEPVPADAVTASGGDCEATAEADHPAATAERSEAPSTSAGTASTPADGPVVTKVEGTTGETLPGPGAAADRPADDMEMSDSVRSKGEDMLVALLINADVSDEYRADVLTEVAAKRPDAVYRRIESVAALTNTELKFLVDTLRAWKAKGQLSAWCSDAADNAALRAEGMLPE